MSRRPVLLLDVDGVVNALITHGYPTTWPTWNIERAQRFWIRWSPDR